MEHLQKGDLKSDKEPSAKALSAIVAAIKVQSLETDYVRNEQPTTEQKFVGEHQSPTIRGLIRTLR